MKILKYLNVLIFSLFLTVPVFADSGSGQISATATSSTTAIGGAHAMFYNEGANEIFLIIKTNEAAGPATTSHGMIPSGGTAVFDTESPNEFSQVSIICSSGETATVHYWFWD